MRRDTTQSSRSRGPTGDRRPGRSATLRLLYLHRWRVGPDYKACPNTSQASGLSEPQASLWRLSPGRGAHHCTPSGMRDVFPLELNHRHLDHSPKRVHPPVRRFPGSPVHSGLLWLRSILTIGVLYLWLTTSLISGTKTGRARDKTESSKLKATVPYSPRRQRLVPRSLPSCPLTVAVAA